MEEKEQELQQGRRLEEKKGLSRGGKIGIACGSAVAGVLLVGYLALCALAAGDKALPGTTLGGIDLGGMTQAQAEAALAQVSTDRFEALEIPIQVEDTTVTFSAKEAGVRVTGDAQEAVQAGKGNFFAGGWNYLTGLLGHKNQVGFTVNVDNADYVNDVFYQVSQAVDQPIEQPHWELEEDEESARLVLYKGKTGQYVDQEALQEALMDALGRGDTTPIEVQVTTQAPGEADFDALVAEIDREPVNASLDLDTEEIVPHQLGLKVDVNKAKELLASMEEGESKALELEVEEPEVTTEQLRASLFQDLLGEGKSNVGGSANRLNNVQLASQACNGVVLLPGEKFSYNQTTGNRTYERGYRAAPGFGTNGTVDMVGGGVCQPSSTLYMACLKADLEIVERTNHRYTVGYMPEGVDAQVAWPSMDFVFANNTPYPIKIEMTVVDRVCTARIYGTKTNDNYIELESVRLGTTPYDTIYQADPSIPQGTTRVLISPYAGRSSEVYKRVYSADGTLISRTLVNRSYYAKCDQVIGYNPADGAPDGSVPAIGEPVVDPETGLPIDPNTGLIVDPNTTTPDLPGGSEPAPTEPTPVEPTPAESAPADPAPVEPVPEIQPPAPEVPNMPPEGIVME